MHWLSNQGYVLMAITAVTWSGNAVIGRAVHETVPPIGLNFWRWVVVLPVFVFLAWPHFRRDWPLVRRHWPILALLSILSISVYNAFVYTGLNTTTAINMLLINTGRPVVIIFLAYLFLGERINALQTVGLILALCGTLTILSRGDLGVLLGVKFITGDLWIVAATLGWAVYTVVFPRKPQIHPTNFMLVTIVMGLAALLPFYLWETIFVRPVPFLATEALWSIAYLGLIAGGLAYLCYNRMVEVLGAGKAGLTSYLVPVIGTALAIGFLGEQFRAFHVAGIALILAGVLLATRSRKMS
jgi:drug/metabolite transporter (DMT)-like permease